MRKRRVARGRPTNGVANPDNPMCRASSGEWLALHDPMLSHHAAGVLVGPLSGLTRTQMSGFLGSKAERPLDDWDGWKADIIFGLNDGPVPTLSKPDRLLEGQLGRLVLTPADRPEAPE